MGGDRQEIRSEAVRDRSGKLLLLILREFGLAEVPDGGPGVDPAQHEEERRHEPLPVHIGEEYPDDHVESDHAPDPVLHPPVDALHSTVVCLVLGQRHGRRDGEQGLRHGQSTILYPDSSPSAS